MYWEETEFRCCFARDTFTPALMAEVLRDFPLGFPPRWIHGIGSRDRWVPFRSEQHLHALAAMEDVTRLRVSSERDGQEGLVVAAIAKWDVQTLHFNLRFDRTEAFKVVDLFMRTPGFHAAYAFNAAYEAWQSETRIQAYEAFGRPHDHLPKVRDPVFDDLNIDIRNNPGHSALVPNMWLLAAWRMWFAPASFRYLPEERLLAFREASLAEKLEGGGVFVELYRDARDAGTPEAQAGEAAFRRWMRLDDLEARAEDLPCRDDPVFEIFTGRFDHGGERLLVTYLDADGRPTRKSRAVTVSRLESALDGTVLHESGQHEA